ncbi:uncharacterized protein LOC144588884 [Pogona vitticeps]
MQVAYRIAYAVNAEDDNWEQMKNLERTSVESRSKRNQRSSNVIDVGGVSLIEPFPSHLKWRNSPDVDVSIGIDWKNDASFLMSTSYKGTSTSRALRRLKEPRTPAHEKLGSVGQKSGLRWLQQADSASEKRRPAG